MSGHFPFCHMKRLFPIAAALLLAACSKTYFTPDSNALLSNPLYAEQYAEQMVDTMVDLEIYEDPILEDASIKKIVDETKGHWLAVAREARAAQRKGAKGGFIPMRAYAEGEVLFTEDALHVSPQFSATPGPSLHIFITTIVDPRDTEFPDETAIDLGEIASMQGAQSFPVPAMENWKIYRTVVLWDRDLKRLYAFAQISP